MMPRMIGSNFHDLVIFPMVAEDLEQVLAIEIDSFPHAWTREHFLDELKSPHSFPMTAFDREGRVVGYICSMQLLEAGHIFNVAVIRDSRGQGIGEILVKNVLRECRERGADYVSLEVRPSNKSAISLYLRLGFCEVGRRKRYYENGEDAIIMEYLFTGNKDDGDAM